MSIPFRHLVFNDGALLFFQNLCDQTCIFLDFSGNYSGFAGQLMEHALRIVFCTAFQCIVLLERQLFDSC